MRLSGPDAEFRTAYIAAWEGDAAAYDEIVALIDATPADSSRLSWVARLADHLGELDDAQRYRRLQRIGPHYGPMNVSVGLGERRPLGDAAVGTGTHYYGSYTYRREQPVDLLPPGQPGLVLVTNVEVHEGDLDGPNAPDQTTP